MKRHISLYIGGRPADLDEDGTLLLFNYTQEEISNPTIVKNSWSQQATLPGTRRNAHIFGAAFRLDRSIAAGGSVGASFNPSQRTDFAIYGEDGTLLQSGYCRLDAVTGTGPGRKYKVSFFGNLGAFFYALAYDSQGSKRDLSTLNYLRGERPDSELDFVINRNAVTNAWARLWVHNPGTNPEQMWDVINFAPAYNGYPEGDFKADKAIATPSDLGLEDTITDGDDTYTTVNGYGLFNLADKRTEWEVKDLRSYLQRPVLSMLAFLRAIEQAATDAGFTFDYSGIPMASYYGVWKTLPMLPSLGSFKSLSTGDITLTITSNAIASGTTIGYITAAYANPTLQNVTVDTRNNICFTMPGSAPQAAMALAYTNTTDVFNWQRVQTLVFAQLVALDGNSNVIGGSPVKCLTGTASNISSAEDAASRCGFTPWWAGAGYESITKGAVLLYAGGVYSITCNLTCTAPAPTHWEVKIHTYQVITNADGGYFHILDTGCRPYFYAANNDSPFMAVNASMTWAAPVTSIEASTSMRSWTTVTKKALLAGDYTPADYLIGFAKMHGFVFLYDNALKKVSLIARDGFFQDTGTIDLTRRIDLSKEATIVPMNLTAKWYDFHLPVVEGAFAKEYKDIYGLDYGIQRVDTGYDFDAQAVDLLDGIPYRGAVSSLERSRYFYTLIANQGEETEQYLPTIFSDAGQTYTLWDTDGNGKDIGISLVGANITATPWNNAYPGYDVANCLKLQCHTADGKVQDGEDVLVYLAGRYYIPYAKVSDDTTQMLALNEGAPCWDITPNPGVTYIPVFSRWKGENAYNGGPDQRITRSLDFGIPREIDTPSTTFSGRAYTLYVRGWSSYLRDRLSIDTKVLRCRVDLSGLQVGQELLRRFFYYGGALWVLNKISNYSLTTWDPAECEFIQVQDKDDYINGQSY